MIEPEGREGANTVAAALTSAHWALLHARTVLSILDTSRPAEPQNAYYPHFALRTSIRCEQVLGTKVQRLVYLLCLRERQEAQAEPNGEETAEFSEQEATWAMGRGWEGSDHPHSCCA